MKRLAAFLKATTLGGLFVVLPVVLVFALLGKAVLGVHDTMESIMVKLAGEGSDVAHFPMAFAVLIVVAISFMLGLTMISRRGKAASSWFERALLYRVPGYTTARALVGGFANIESDDAFKPGLLTLDEGIQCLVLITEDHGNGLLTVFLPGSPSPASGNVQIVSKDLVRPLNVRLADIATAHQQWGVGVKHLLAKHAAATHSPLSPAAELTASPPP